MKKTLFLFAVASALVAGSCVGGGPKDAEGFPPAETLTADSVAIGEVLQPRWGGLYGDYAVLISPQTSKMVFRYRLPDWAFVDSSFVQGGGPDDLQYGFLEGTNNSDGTFWLSEPLRKTLMQFGDRDGKLQRLRTVANGTPLRVYFGQVLDNRVVVNDRRDEVMETTDGVDTYLLSSVMGDSLVRTDSVLCYSKTYVRMEREGDMTYMGTLSYNAPQYKVWGDRMAVWYPDTQNMLVYRVSPDGKMSLENTYGDTLSMDRIRSVDVKGYEQEKPSPKLIAVTGDYLFLQTTVLDKPLSQATRENPPKVVGNEIRVYDWQMNPVSKFELDKKDAISVWADPMRNKMYAYDPREDFEQVYVYEYEL